MTRLLLAIFFSVFVAGCGPVEPASSQPIPEPDGNETGIAVAGQGKALEDNAVLVETTPPTSEPSPAVSSTQASVADAGASEPTPVNSDLHPPPVHTSGPLVENAPDPNRVVEESALVLKGNRYHYGDEALPFTGRAKRWNPGGWKEAEGNFRDGFRHGEWNMWFENGRKGSVVLFSNSKPDGPAVYWHPNGRKMQEGHWKQGRFVATARWDETGNAVPLETPVPEESNEL